MSPHLAGERALRAACATLVASKRMKEHCNGWKASCMLKRPNWWLAITHLPLFISLNVLVTQTACLRCHKAPWQQRTRYIYLISTVNVSLREGRLIYYLKRFQQVFLIYITHSDIKSLAFHPITTSLSLSQVSLIICYLQHGNEFVPITH